jgi:hypothetical protein
MLGHLKWIQITNGKKYKIMQITHEIREYIISDGGNKYSVRHNVMEDVYSIKQIVLNESQWDRNSMVYFDVTEDFLNRVKDVINKLETN